MTSSRVRRIAPLLALAAFTLVPAPVAAQDDEEERVLRICQQLGQAELEVGIDGHDPGR